MPMTFQVEIIIDEKSKILPKFMLFMPMTFQAEIIIGEKNEILPEFIHFINFSEKNYSWKK